MNVKDFILEKLQKVYPIPEKTNLDTFNFVESGYVDSLGIIQFVAELEEEYDIEFSDEELSSKEFQYVGSLVSTIEKKLENI